MLGISILVVFCLIFSKIIKFETYFLHFVAYLLKKKLSEITL